MKRLALLTLLLAAVPAAPSPGATVALDGSTLRFTAASGEANHPTFHHRAEDELVVYDARFGASGVTAGPGCAQDGDSTVICPRTGVARAEFQLADRGPSDFTRDLLTLTADVPVPVSASAAPGSGAGVAYIDLRPVEASLDGLANDGPAGRMDDLGPGIDDLLGGDGADTLTGDDADNALFGDNGADRIAGGGGDDDLTLATYNDVGADAVGLETRGADTATCGDGLDVVFHDRSDTAAGDCELRVLVTDEGFSYRGTSGSDRIIARFGPAEVRGGGGDDRLGATADVGEVVLSGDSGNDRIAGNRHADSLTGGTGRDLVYGAEGDDRIRVDDRFTDRVSCGRGRDTVTADRRDRIGRDCERVRYR
jgi:Ca2+-binding RTX toxin-like protein